MSIPAWYHGSRQEFLAESNIAIANQLAGRAADESLEIESFQSDEWRRSINLLQCTLDKRIPILREVLESDSGHWIRHVILEFDFRRRGLRMDCLLLGDGVIFVVEFKRSKIQAADRDQVITYAVNLMEFHAITRLLIEKNEGVIVVPVLTLTEGKTKVPVTWPGLGGHSWPSMTRTPIECDSEGLAQVLRLGLENRRTREAIPPLEWLRSPFSPSSSILDATLSLYGNHDVSAIKEHAAPRAQIEASVNEIRDLIAGVLKRGDYHVVFLSGAPGAGKTLVGLDLVMRGTNADQSVFVTGNAPLVEVLNEALRKSYKLQGRSGATWTQTGYHRKNAALVGEMFEQWACRHVAFHELDDVWPYLLTERFGAVCLEIMDADSLVAFDADDCLRIAFKLRLPMWVDGSLPLPFCVDAANPQTGAKFHRLRIQTVRQELGEDGGTAPFTEDDDPFDENYGAPFFGIYGVDEEGLLDHVAIRDTYQASRSLLADLLPGVGFPEEVIAFSREDS